MTREELLAKNIPTAVIEQVFNYNGTENSASYFCVTCRRSILQKKIPKLSITNGLEFPTIASELSGLSKLEERLIAARHVFQSIWTVMGVRGQYRTKGSIVNIPVSVDTTVSNLPRLLDDTHDIHLRLARRMMYSSNYMDGNIRPAVIWNAANYICRKALYREYSIQLTDDWLDQIASQINSINREQNETNIVDNDLEANEEGNIQQYSTYFL